MAPRKKPSLAPLLLTQGMVVGLVLCLLGYLIVIGLPLVLACLAGYVALSIPDSSDASEEPWPAMRSPPPAQLPAPPSPAPSVWVDRVVLAMPVLAALVVLCLLIAKRI